MITPIEQKTGRLKPSIQPTGKMVEIEYVENALQFHEEKASGEIEGQKFTLHSGMDGSIWVQFKNMKGQIPKLRIPTKAFIEAAYEVAKENNLLKK